MSPLAAQEVAGSEILADSQATQPVVTATVIWKLTWTVRWKILFQMMIFKNISPRLSQASASIKHFYSQKIFYSFLFFF